MLSFFLELTPVIYVIIKYLSVSNYFNGNLISIEYGYQSLLQELPEFRNFVIKLIYSECFISTINYPCQKDENYLSLFFDVHDKNKPIRVFYVTEKASSCHNDKLHAFFTDNTFPYN